MAWEYPAGFKTGFAENIKLCKKNNFWKTDNSIWEDAVFVNCVKRRRLCKRLTAAT